MFECDAPLSTLRHFFHSTTFFLAAVSLFPFFFKLLWMMPVLVTRAKTLTELNLTINKSNSS